MNHMVRVAAPLLLAAVAWVPLGWVPLAAKAVPAVLALALVALASRHVHRTRLDFALALALLAVAALPVLDVPARHCSDAIVDGESPCTSVDAGPRPLAVVLIGGFAWGRGDLATTVWRPEAWQIALAMAWWGAVVVLAGAPWRTAQGGADA